MSSTTQEGQFTHPLISVIKDERLALIAQSQVLSAFLRPQGKAFIEAYACLSSVVLEQVVPLGANLDTDIDKMATNKNGFCAQCQTSVDKFYM